MVSVIVGGGLFGLPGMLLGVPIFAAIYTLVQEGAERRLRKKELSANDVSPPVVEDDPEDKQKSKSRDSTLLGKASELFNNKKGK